MESNEAQKRIAVLDMQWREAQTGAQSELAAAVSARAQLEEWRSVAEDLRATVEKLRDALAVEERSHDEVSCICTVSIASFFVFCIVEIKLILYFVIIL
jgi:hypothetical protein